MKILTADCPKIAVENPMHAGIFDMPPYSQEIQPFMFGHPYTKKNAAVAQKSPDIDGHRHRALGKNVVPVEQKR